MNKISLSDEDISSFLVNNNIPHSTRTGYKYVQNNNLSVTDDKNFFLKFNANPNQLEIELETISKLSFSIKPLINNIANIGPYFCLALPYVANETAKIENMNTIRVNALIMQIKELQSISPNEYKHNVPLEAFMKLMKDRIQKADISQVREKALNSLVDKIGIPYINKYYDSKNIVHTDIKLENIICTSDNEVKLIDYESVKAGPSELDLASLYQDLFQTGEKKLYSKINKQWESSINLNQDVLAESVLFKNLVTTTYAAKVNIDLLDLRIELLNEALKTNSLPDFMPKVSPQ
jgi:thiamine kinase-like enzyme